MHIERTLADPLIGNFPKEWLRGLLLFDKKISWLDERWRRHGHYRKTSTSPIFYPMKPLYMHDVDSPQYGDATVACFYCTYVLLFVYRSNWCIVGLVKVV